MLLLKESKKNEVLSTAKSVVPVDSTEYVQNNLSNLEENTRDKIAKEETNAVSNVQETIQTSAESEIERGLPILMYHFFYDKNVSKGSDSNWLEISIFEEQMKYLSENNYYFPSWEEVADYVDGKISLPAKSVVITADAGIKVAVTTKSGRVYKGADKLELPRMRIMDGMSLNAFKNIVK